MNESEWKDLQRLWKSSPQHAEPVVAEIDRLLHEKEFPMPLDDGGNRHRRLPDAHAAFFVFFRMKSAMRCTPDSIACLEAA